MAIRKGRNLLYEMQMLYGKYADEPLCRRNTITEVEEWQGRFAVMNPIR